MKRIFRAFGTGLLVYCLAIASVNANVIIAGTRVIFPAQDGEVTVRLSNDNTTPALIEAWIDSGDAHSTPDKVDVPFLITPPLFRMEAHKDQSLRVLYTPGKQPLPDDRESLFWLNVLEIPPKPSGDETKGKNILQFAIRSRLKLFYRPAHLPGDAQKAPEQVTWRAVAEGQGYVLEVHNPTPYHITIIKLSLEIGGKQYSADTGMVDPLGTLHLQIKGLTALPAAGTSVAYDTVNDFGAAASFKGSVAP